LKHATPISQSHQRPQKKSYEEDKGQLFFLKTIFGKLLKVLSLGVWRQSSQPPEANDSGGGALSTWRFFSILKKNNAFLIIFYLKFMIV